MRIEAPPSVVWQTTLDIESWPSWASQFKRLERIDAGPLALGSRVRVRPNWLPASVWRVTEYDEGRLFTWVSTLVPGVHLAGGHELTADGTATRAEFWLAASGPLGRLLSPMLGRLVFSRNTRTATEGLKHYVERART